MEHPGLALAGSQISNPRGSQTGGPVLMITGMLYCYSQNVDHETTSQEQDTVVFNEGEITHRAETQINTEGQHRLVQAR